LNHEVPDGIEAVGLDLCDEVVFAEQRIQLDDALDAAEFLVDGLLMIRFNVEEDESNRRTSSLFHRTSGV
jgi:hypothetical protein